MTPADLHRPPPTTAPMPALRERELSRLWHDQELPPEALVTTDGRELVIVYRGRRGAGPGPDFRDAVIRGLYRGKREEERGKSRGGQAAACGEEERAELVRGDVELHVRSSDFCRHGHHLDRAYLRLALHVVFEDDAGPTVLADGRVVPTVALAPWVQRRAGEIRLALADPAAYREPCHSAVARLGVEAVLAVLIERGGARLRERASRMTKLIALLGAEQALYTAIARGLGLTRNVEPMERLAQALPLAELRAIADAAGDPPLAVTAALLGAAGILGGQLPLWPQGREQRWAVAKGVKYRARPPLAIGEERECRLLPAGNGDELLAAWGALGAPRAGGLEWAEGPYRPGCAPRDRLVGLAALVLRPGPPLDATSADWRALFVAGPAAVLETLRAETTIGRDRALELAVNAVLPWLLATFPEDAELANAVVTAYAALPAPPSYGSTRLLSGALLDGRERSLVRGVAALQGALQMTREWCTQGGCGLCPLS